VVVSLKDLSASIWLWKRNNGHWGATKVIEIPAEPADPNLMPTVLKGFKAVPPFVTDINLSLDDKWLYVSCWGTIRARATWFGNRRNLSDYRRSKLLARKLAGTLATVVRLPVRWMIFWPNRTPSNFSLAKSRGLWASKLTWQTFRVCTEEMDDLPQRPSN
jgi:hypothetical protein